MRILSLPAMVLGVALAILFFKVYGMVTRPSVPRPIAFVVTQFAPGVEIGSTIAEARHHVAGMTYVPHLGYVGLPAPHAGNMPNGFTLEFAQVRLLLDERTRVQRRPDQSRARVDAVEIVSVDARAPGELTGALSTMFRRPSRDGCIRTADPGRLREVHLWTTPNERGGLAVTYDYKADPRAADGPMVTSVVAFGGQFLGGRTLRADYADAACAQLAEPR